MVVHRVLPAVAERMVALCQASLESHHDSMACVLCASNCHGRSSNCQRRSDNCCPEMLSMCPTCAVGLAAVLRHMQQQHVDWLSMPSSGGQRVEPQLCKVI
jgi:hypothetical protein